MMTWLRRLGLLVLVTVLVWLGIIAYWRAIRLAPTPADVGLYLLALPLSLWLALLLAAALVRRKRQKYAPAEDGALTSLEGGVTGPEGRAAINRVAVNVLAAEVITPHGNTIGEIARRLETDMVPPLDAALTDYNGFPLPARRCADLDLAAVPAEWRSGEASSLPDGQQRALALLAALMSQLAPVLQVLSACMTPPDAGGLSLRQGIEMNPAWYGGASAPVADKAEDIPGPLDLRVVVMLEPMAVGDAALAAWISAGLAGMGIPIAADRIEMPRITTQALSAFLQDALSGLAAEPRPSAVLIMSAGSTLCQAVVDRWLEQLQPMAGALQFAGEAAGALLLASKQLALPSLNPLAAVHELSTLPCDEPGLRRPHLSTVLSELMSRQSALTAMPNELTWLCSGMGMGPEAIEVAPLLQATQPPVQMDEVLHLRGAVGDVPLAGRLAAWALACQQVLARQLPCQLVLNDGVIDRGLCLLMPANAPHGEESVGMATEAT
jgi:hypothetical protein